MPNRARNAKQPKEYAPRLLVLDDDVVQRTIISRIGRQCGFHVVGAATLQEAEQLVREWKFDCVTIDIALGADCGAALLGKLSNQDGLISIVVISGADRKILQATADKARSLGFVSHAMTKPLNLIELRAVLGEKCRDAPIQRSLNKLPASTV